MKNNAIWSPEWLSRSVVYQINPRTFSKEGTIRAITEELEFIRSLGIRIVYLCPVFLEDSCQDDRFWSRRQKASETNNPKNPYKIIDYFEIDEEYGNREDLRELVEQAHRLDMKVLLDLVYMHMGMNAPLLKQHPEFAQLADDGTPLYNEYNFVKLDFKSQGLREFLYSNMVYYIGALDVDGFRCDVGDAVPDDFWCEAHRRICNIKEDAVLINEGFAYERMATSFNCTYFPNWPEVLYQAYTNGQSAETLRQMDDSVRQTVPNGGLLLRYMDSHDTVTDWPARCETAATHDGMEQIEVLNFVMDGVPMLYCGNELACEARVNMFANRFHMGKFEVTDRTQKDTPASKRRQAVIRSLCAWKAQSDVLLYGKTEWLSVSAPKDVFAVARTYGDERIVLVGNIRNVPCEVTVDGIPNEHRVVLQRAASYCGDGAFKLSGFGYTVLTFRKGGKE